MLLPSCMAPRRADGAGVIAQLLPQRPCEDASARLGAELGVPAATVRLGRAACAPCAGDLRQDATAASVS